MSVSAAQSNKFKPGVMTSYSSSNKKNSIHSNTAAKNSMAKSIFNADKAVKSKQFLSTSAAGHVGANRISNSAPRYMNGREASIMFNSNRGSGQVTAFSTNNYMNSGFGMPSFGMGGMNTIDTIMTLTNFGLGVADRLGLFNKSTPTASNSQKVDNATQGLAGNNTNIGSYTAVNTDIAVITSKMASCNTASTLSVAIGEARTELASLIGQSETLNIASETAQTTLKELGTQKEAADKKVTDAKQNVSTCEGSVKTVTDSRNQALEAAKTGNKEYDNAVAEYTKAHDAHVDAQNQKTLAESNKSTAETNANKATEARVGAETEFNNALTAYEQAPDTIPDASGNQVPNPNKSKLKAQADMAKEKLKQAKNAESDAKKALEDAKKALEDASKAETKSAEAETKASEKKSKAYEKLGNLKTKAEEGQKKLDEEQKKLDDCKGNLEKAQENFNTAKSDLNDVENQIAAQNSVVELAKQAQNDVKALTESIEKNEARLTQLEQNEAEAAKTKPQGNSGLNIPQVGTTLSSFEGMTKIGSSIAGNDGTYTHYQKDGQDIYTKNNTVITKEDFESKTLHKDLYDFETPPEDKNANTSA